MTGHSMCNYVASTVCLGTVFAFLVIIPVNFINFTCLHVVSREFLKTRFTKCAQMQFIAGSLESAYSLSWGALRICGQGGGETLALL